VHVTNDEIRHRTCRPPDTSIIITRWLCLFGHSVQADPSQDRFGALWVTINHLPADWQWLRGWPKQNWLQTTELDLQQHNLGLNSTRQCVHNHSRWCQLLQMAMLDDDDKTNTWTTIWYTDRHVFQQLDWIDDSFYHDVASWLCFHAVVASLVNQFLPVSVAVFSSCLLWSQTSTVTATNTSDYSANTLWKCLTAKTRFIHCKIPMTMFIVPLLLPWLPQSVCQ